MAPPTPSGQAQDQTPAPTPAELRALVAALAAHDRRVRDRARQALVDRGAPVVEALIPALRSPNHTMRLEAAKALSAIADPRSVPALIEALDDERFDVRWLAALGLIALPEASLIPLLSALQRTPWSESNLHTGAHQILRTQLRGPYGAIIAPVVAALKGAEPSVTVPLAAYHALGALRDILSEEG
jgi:hypothetical protein